MKLWYAKKPTIAAVQGWCIGGGTDMVLCADLIVAGEGASFGYPPARVWGTPTTAMWVYRMGLEQAKRYLLTGDEIPARDGGRDRPRPRGRSPTPSSRRTPSRSPRAWRELPLNQLVMLKLLCNQTVENMGFASSRLLGTLFDGIARHTQEGLDFVRRAQRGRLPPGGARARRSVRGLRQPAEGGQGAAGGAGAAWKSCTPSTRKPSIAARPASEVSHSAKRRARSTFACGCFAGFTTRTP